MDDPTIAAPAPQQEQSTPSTEITVSPTGPALGVSSSSTVPVEEANALDERVALEETIRQTVGSSVQEAFEKAGAGWNMPTPASEPPAEIPADVTSMTEEEQFAFIDSELQRETGSKRKHIP